MKQVIEKIKSSKQKGITLIALIITIIILLILVGVTINVLIGDNGLLKTAKEAGESYKIEGIRETVEAEILNVEMGKLNLGNEITIELVLQELLDKKIFDNIDKEAEIGYIEEYEVKLKYDNNNSVIIEYIKKTTGIRITYQLEPSTYTNKKEVNIILKVQGKVKKITKPDKTVKETNKDIEEISYKATSNGIYTFIVENLEGKLEEKNVIVDIIDILPPKDFEIIAETTKIGGIIITAIAEDDEADEISVKSGIERYEYYTKLTTESEYTKHEQNEIKGLPSGRYKIYAVAYDKAGNPKKSNEIELEIEEWIEIWNEQDLRDIAEDLTRNYILMADIELKEEWIKLRKNFSGTLEGNNYKIKGLKLNGDASDFQGMFSSIDEKGKVSNLSLECNIEAEGNKIGGLAGQNNGKIENVKVTGAIKGHNCVGGIAGVNCGTIKNTIAVVELTSGGNGASVGGIVGDNVGKIENVKASGTVKGYNYVGGIAGSNITGNASIISAFSEALVEGENSGIGGLVGLNSETIEKSVSIGPVTGYGHVGGLVGINRTGTIKNAYSTGEVTGSIYVGGLVGYNNSYGSNYPTPTITNSYTLSKVIGKKSSIGGLVGDNEGTITNSYWSQETAEVQTSSGGTSKTLDEMKMQETYKNWDFTSRIVWKMVEYPELIFDSYITD